VTRHSYPSGIGIRPLIYDGTVTVDLHARELVVRPSSNTRPLAKVLWDQMVEDLRSRSWVTRPRTPWAHGNGERQIAYDLPSDGNTLRFRFPPGDPKYRALVSRPGLAARVAVNLVNGEVIGITFRGHTR
jgi:hypothetical protein